MTEYQFINFWAILCFILYVTQQNVPNLTKNTLIQYHDIWGRLSIYMHVVSFYPYHANCGSFFQRYATVARYMGDELHWIMVCYKGLYCLTVWRETIKSADAIVKCRMWSLTMAPIFIMRRSESTLSKVILKEHFSRCLWFKFKHFSVDDVRWMTSMDTTRIVSHITT